MLNTIPYLAPLASATINSEPVLFKIIITCVDEAAISPTVALLASILGPKLLKLSATIGLKFVQPAFFNAQETNPLQSSPLGCNDPAEIPKSRAWRRFERSFLNIDRKL